jgi:putative transcriptional regulator
VTRERTEIWWRRVRVGLSQEELAADLGVSRQTVNSVENGRSAPSLRLALAFAARFEAPVTDLWNADAAPRPRSS